MYVRISCDREANTDRYNGTWKISLARISPSASGNQKSSRMLCNRNDEIRWVHGGSYTGTGPSVVNVRTHSLVFFLLFFTFFLLTMWLWYVYRKHPTAAAAVCGIIVVGYFIIRHPKYFFLSCIYLEEPCQDPLK